MEIEKQVASLELSKKLKELGYPQEGLFWWRNDGGTDYVTIIEDRLHISYAPDTLDFVEEYSEAGDFQYFVSPTVAELGEWLPEDCEIMRRDGQWLCYNDLSGESRAAETEADARAKMLIWLVENKYVSFEKP